MNSLVQQTTYSPIQHPLAAAIKAHARWLILPLLGANFCFATSESDVETVTFNTIATICPQMAALNATGDLDSTEEQLFFRCRELVQTNNELQGSGATDFSLGLSESEFDDAIRRVAPEETEAMGAGATDTAQDQLTNLGNRMQVLRTGSLNQPVAGISWSGDSFGGLSAGDSDASRWGMFINGIYGTGEKDRVGNEDGFDFDAYGLTLGVDYRYSDEMVAGVAFGFSNSEVDLDNNFGDYDTDGYSLSLYGTYYSKNWYFEGSFTYGEFEYDGDRNITISSNDPDVESVSDRVKTDTDGDQIAYSLAAGFNGNRDQWHYHFFGRLSGIESELDAYTESGSELAMRVDSQDVDSLQGVLGAQLSFNSSQDYGVFIPFLSLEARHEFDNDSRSITARYVFDPTITSFSFTTEDPDEDFFLLSIGTSFVLKSGTQFFLNYDSVIELDDVDSDTLTLGIRFEL